MSDSDFVKMIRASLNDSGKPFGLTTIINVVNEDAGDKLEEIMRNVGVQSRMEPGNLTYDVNRDLVDRTRFVVYDRWESPEAMAAHEQSEHFQAGIAGINRLLASPPTTILVELIGH